MRRILGCLILVALASPVTLASPVAARTICGHDIKIKGLVYERASKWYAGDKRDKKALGSLITECEVDDIRYLVSSPDGKADNPHISGYIYEKRPQSAQ